MISSGLRARALAMDMSWRSPLEIDIPPSESTVSRPSGNPSIRVRQFESLIICCISFWGISLFPKPILSLMVSENRKGSCITRANLALRSGV